MDEVYVQFSEHLSNGKTAQLEENFHVAKECYAEAEEGIKILLSKYGPSDELLDDYALLLIKVSLVELMLGNTGAAMKAVEKSIKYNPTAEVCIIALTIVHNNVDEFVKRQNCVNYVCISM